MTFVFRLAATLLMLGSLAACVAPDSRRIVGEGKVLVHTDGGGRVTKATMIEPIHPLIDQTVTAFALKNWRGPANSTKIVPITYLLNDGPPDGSKAKTSDASIRTNS